MEVCEWAFGIVSLFFTHSLPIFLNKLQFHRTIPFQEGLYMFQNPINYNYN